MPAASIAMVHPLPVVGKLAFGVVLPTGALGALASWESPMGPLTLRWGE